MRPTRQKNAEALRARLFPVYYKWDMKPKRSFHRNAITSLCMLTISCAGGASATSTRSINHLPNTPKLPYAEVIRLDVPPQSANERFLVIGDEFNELRARLPKHRIEKRGVGGVSGWEPRALVVFHETADQSQSIEISWTYFAGLDPDGEFGLDPSFQSYFERLQKAHEIPSGRAATNPPPPR